MKSKLIMASLIAALSFSLGAMADDDGDRGGDTLREQAPTDALSTRDFQVMDTNGDGYISKDEAKTASFKNRFEQLDVNHDGKLSMDELNNNLVAMHHM